MKKKTAENEDHEEFEVDEPSEVEELQNNGSDDDWTPAAQETVGRRTSGRVKAPKRMIEENSSSEDISETEEVKKKKPAPRGGGRGGRGRGRGRGGRGGSTTKRVKTEKDEDEEENEEEGDETSSESDSGDTPIEFRSGSFVVLKSDFKTGGEHPVWKIDGKSLLQKYVHSKDDEDGESIYKSTTIYAGWSKSAKDSYYPINVETKKQKGKDHIVVFDRSQIKMDEDDNENEDEEASENEKEQEGVKESV